MMDGTAVALGSLVGADVNVEGESFSSYFSILIYYVMVMYVFFYDGCKRYRRYPINPLPGN